MPVCLICEQDVTEDQITHIEVTPEARQLLDDICTPGTTDRTKHLAVFCKTCEALPEGEMQALAMDRMAEIFADIAEDIALDRACEGQKPS